MQSSAAGIATLLALGALWLTPPAPRAIKPTYWLPCAILIPLAAIAGWRITLPVILISAIVGAIVAPALTLAAYLRVSFIIQKLTQQQPRPAERQSRAGGRALRVPLAWLLTYGSAWTVALIDAIDLYNSLPKKPPDC